jgi:hypothetical protein
VLLLLLLLLLPPALRCRSANRGSLRRVDEDHGGAGGGVGGDTPADDDLPFEARQCSRDDDAGRLRVRIERAILTRLVGHVSPLVVTAEVGDSEVCVCVCVCVCVFLCLCFGWVGWGSWNDTLFLFASDDIVVCETTS